MKYCFATAAIYQLVVHSWFLPIVHVQLVEHIHMSLRNNLLKNSVIFAVLNFSQLGFFFQNFDFITNIWPNILKVRINRLSYSIQYFMAEDHDCFSKQKLTCIVCLEFSRQESREDKSDTTGLIDIQ